MNSVALGRTLGASVLVVAALQTLSSLSMPVAARRLDAITIAVAFALLIGHAALYWFGERLRARFGLSPYGAAQAVTLFGFAIAARPGPVTLGLLMLLTVELVLLAGTRWGTIPIIAGAITLFVIAQLITSGLYQAMTAGLVLFLTGAVAHAVAVLIRRRATEPTMPVSVPAGVPLPVVASGNLSARETEVLRQLVSGARNSEIAATLQISERTVKAHLASIYLKLGVESRSAAVAAALQQRLV